MTALLDQLDLRILTELQADATLPLVDLAARVNSSKSVCWRRIQRFVNEGIISGRVTLVDPEKVGFEIMILTFVKLDTRGDIKTKDVIDEIAKIPEVIECHAMMGEYDLFLKIVVTSIKHYQTLMFERFTEMAGIQDVTSSISLTRFFSSTNLPLKILPPAPAA